MIVAKSEYTLMTYFRVIISPVPTCRQGGVKKGDRKMKKVVVKRMEKIEKRIKMGKGTKIENDKKYGGD